MNLFIFHITLELHWSRKYRLSFLYLHRLIFASLKNKVRRKVLQLLRRKLTSKKKKSCENTFQQLIHPNVDGLKLQTVISMATTKNANLIWTLYYLLFFFSSFCFFLKAFLIFLLAWILLSLSTESSFVSFSLSSEVFLSSIFNKTF